MRDLHHYLKIFTGAETVGAQLLAEAVHVARHGTEVDREGRKPIADALPDRSLASEARQRVLVEAALYADADEDEGRYDLQERLADRLGVAPRTVRSWLSGERPLEGPARRMVEQIAGVG